jgi:hypothetical protein
MSDAVDHNAQKEMRRKEGGTISLPLAQAVNRAYRQALPGLRGLLLSFVLLFAAAAPTAAQQMNCRVFDDLVALVHLSEQFLNDVETGAETGAANRLSNFLRQTSVVDLRIRIVENGFDKISGSTSKIMALQKTLLRMRAIGGQFKAAESARKLRIRSKLEAYRKELVTLPCSDVHGVWRKPGESVNDALVSTQTASIGAVMVLILGVFAFLLFDRIQKRNSGKRKRFLCRADCKMQIEEDEPLVEAQIVDISRIGAKVKTEALGAVGSEVEITFPKKRMIFPDHTVTYEAWSLVGKVMWCKGDYLGLEFKEVLSQERMDQLISAS